MREKREMREVRETRHTFNEFVVGLEKSLKMTVDFWLSVAAFAEPCSTNSILVRIYT